MNLHKALEGMTEADRKVLMQKVQETAHQLVSDDDFQRQFDAAKATAIKTMEESGEVTMMFIAHMKRRSNADESKPEWENVPIMFADWPPPDDEKQKAMEGLGAKLGMEFPDHLLVSVIQVAEAWMAQYHEEDVQDGMLPDYVPSPSKKADRQEILMIDGCTMDYRTHSVALPILRKDFGGFAGFGVPMEMGDGKESKGTNHLIHAIFQGAATVARKRVEDELSGGEPMA